MRLVGRPGEQPADRIASPDSEGSPLQIRSSYFICFTPRTGSTLLCDLLASTGVAGRPEEYFHPDVKASLQEPVWRLDWRTRQFPEVLERIKRYGTTPNGIFASKLKWHDMGRLDAGIRLLFGHKDLSGAELLASAFPHPQYVWITRRDKVRQAISLYRARQSQQWTRTTDEPISRDSLQFSYQLIDLALRHIVRVEAAWAEFFQHAEIIPLTVIYEDLVQDPTRVTRKLLDELQIAVPDGFSFPPPRVKRQADEVSAEWIHLYREMDQRRSRRRKFAALPTVLATPRLWHEYLWDVVRRSAALQ